MIKLNLIFFTLLCCSVRCASGKYSLVTVEADELKCETTQVFESALENKTSVFVVVIRAGERYTGLYDIREEKNRLYWRPPGTDQVGRYMIMPVMDALKNEALRGYEQRHFCGPQKDFSKEFQCTGGALTWRYKRSVFFSEGIRRFLTLWCSKLQEKGKVSWPHYGRRLTDDVLQSLEPPVGWWLSFIMQDRADAVAEVIAGQEDDPIKVFMTLPGLGVVKGVAVRRESWMPAKETIFSAKSFLSHKIDAVQDSMRAFYPYDEETWKASCLNYCEA